MELVSTRRNRLHEAAIEGNVTILLELLQQDPMLLARVNLNDLNETPLHVAALLGHEGFVHETLKRRPQLAKELDSRRSSALHSAAAKGFVRIVKRLLEVDANMCLWCDADGRNPLHLAAMTGQVEVLAALVEAKPTAARTSVDGGTVLHLCVKYNQLEALGMLIETVGGTTHLNLNCKDEYGFTVLHLAVSNKQLQMVQYLTSNVIGMEVNALNSNGLTALDILAQSKRDLKDMDIAETLRANGAIRTTNRASSSSNQRSKLSKWCGVPLGVIFSDQDNNGWLSRKQDALMVVASLIAAVAFSAGVNPPGGVWQDDNSSGNKIQTAGTSIFAAKHNDNYNEYLACNTTGFTASLIVMLMLISGLPFKHPVAVWILILAMWVAVASMAATYGRAIKFLTPIESRRIIYKILFLWPWGLFYHWVFSSLPRPSTFALFSRRGSARPCYKEPKSKTIPLYLAIDMHVSVLR